MWQKFMDLTNKEFFIDANKTWNRLRIQWSQLMLARLKGGAFALEEIWGFVIILFMTTCN
jgi:hypothetical protein